MIPEKVITGQDTSLLCQTLTDQKNQPSSDTSTTTTEAKSSFDDVLFAETEYGSWGDDIGQTSLNLVNYLTSVLSSGGSRNVFERYDTRDINIKLNYKRGQQAG